MSETPTIKCICRNLNMINHMLTYEYVLIYYLNRSNLYRLKVRDSSMCRVLQCRWRCNGHITAICWFSPKRTAERNIRAKTVWLGLSIMCLSGTTCLLAECCFSKLSLYKSDSSCWSNTKRLSSSSAAATLSYQNITCSRHDISAKFLIWRQATTTTHSMLS